MATKLCKDCKEEFTLKTEEVNFFKEKGLVEPQRCKDCRTIRKQPMAIAVNAALVKATNITKQQPTKSHKKHINKGLEVYYKYSQ